jgi:hypothetical protein
MNTNNANALLNINYWKFESINNIEIVIDQEISKCKNQNLTVLEHRVQKESTIGNLDIENLEFTCDFDI